jgi:hypothetical protein
MIAELPLAPGNGPRFGLVYQRLFLSPTLNCLIDLLPYISMTVVIYSLCATTTM